MRYFYAFYFLFIVSASSNGQSSVPNSPLITNGGIKAMATDGSTVYFGGGFSYVGPDVPYGVGINPSTGVVSTGFPRPDYIIKAVIPDGSGGWYIGGDFTSIGGVTRNRLARINSDGSLHDWNPNLSGGSVNALALGGGIVYVGGTFNDFNNFGGKSRNKLAAVDASSGVVSDWNPAPDGNVRTIAVSGSTVYVGGDFFNIGGQARNRIAGLDATTNTNNATSWDPNANGTVYTLTVSGSTIYVGGTFGTIGGQTRNKIAALDANTNTNNALSWYPAVTSGWVNSIVLDGSLAYVGGTFTSIGGQARNRLAAVNTSTGVVTSWNPDADYDVNKLIVSGTNIYVGGQFTTIGGLSKKGFAVLDASTGNANNSFPSISDQIYGFAISGSTLYLGGDFISVGGEVRNRLAAVDATTGQLTSWNPNADGTVYSLAVNGTTVYAGGDFSNLGGVSRGKIAAVHATTGVISDWNPAANGSVRSIATDGSRVYIGGTFTSVGGQSRDRIAALDATVNTNNAIATWNPGADDNVRALALNGTTLYVGGDFVTLGGATRNHLGAINAATGNLLGWDPDADDYVYALGVRSGTVYAGGDFSTIGGTTRNRIAAIDAVSGAPTSWNPNGNGAVWTLTFSGSALYVGGSFSNIGGASRNKIAALNINTGSAFSWNPNAGSTVYGIAVTTSGTFIGGDFTRIGSTGTNRHFTGFPNTTIEWGGTAGASWNATSNWAPGITPSGTQDLIIATGGPQLDVDYTHGSGKTMTLSGSGSLTINAGKRLTVAGTANFGGRPVIFKSSSFGTASLGAVTGSVTNATSVTVERYLPAGRKWRLLTAPLTGSSNNSIFYNWQNNDVVSAGTGVEIWGPGGHADPSNSNTGLALGGAASMRSYGTGWADVTNTNTSLLFDNTTNFGFALFAAGPYNNGTSIISPSQAAQSTTLSATGTIITGDHTKTFNATAANQYFLVGNPYASPIDPRSFTTTPTVNRTNLNSKLWMWDAKPGVGTGNGLGIYVSFDLSINQYNVPTLGYPDSSVMIQSGQAFFVQSTASGAATLVFHESSKDASGSHAMMGDQNNSPKALLRLTLQSSDGTENLDGAVAVFHADGKTSLDPYDGSKLMNTSENIFFRREGRNLTFEHHPPVETQDTIFMRVSNLSTRTYRLQSESQHFSNIDGWRAELKDRFTGKSTMLDLQGKTTQEFQVTPDSLSTGDRFMVVFSKSAANSGQTPDDIPASAGMKLFPNPVRGQLRLRLDATPSGTYSVNIINSAGARVWQREGISQDIRQLDINTSGLPAGLYRLSVTDAQGLNRINTFVKD